MASSNRPRFPSGLKLLNTAFGGWTALVFIFLYLPIALLVVYSFNSSRLNILWEGFTFRWYQDVWGHTRLMAALKNSLIIAAVTTVSSVVLGTVGAWLLHRYRYRFSRALQTLVAMPMIMPEIVMGVSFMIFFTTVSLQLGFTTVIIAHTTFSFPFVLVAVQARLQGLDPALEEAALDLGATPLKAFWLVIVPCLRPAIISGGLMAFTLSMDELIITVFTTSAVAPTLPVVVFGMAKVGLNPMLNALSTVFILSTIAFVLFTEHLRKLSQR
ncbi:MAG TPA: ABC transporter permease [Opitutaceae bacterium]|nr:ABC transporter permease [Opitutaceae bacterium]